MRETKYFPRRLSFPKICDILIGYLNTGAEKKYVGVSEVVEKSNVTLHNISRNNIFLKSWHFIKESDTESGKYILSRDAAEFIFAYKIDPKGKETRELLKKVLSENEILVKFIYRIIQEKLSKEEILVGLPRIVGDLKADKVGLTSFMDMLLYAFSIEENIASIKSGIDKQKEHQLSNRLKISMSENTTKQESSLSNINISLVFNINPQISPKKFKEYLKALREVLM